MLQRSEQRIGLENNPSTMNHKHDGENISLYIINVKGNLDISMVTISFQGAHSASLNWECANGREMTNECLWSLSESQIN